MNKEEKFYYSELEDEIIINSIQAEFKNRQIERKPYELIWELNMNFYLGNQYSYISNSGELLDVERTYMWENREVYNHIAPIIESRLAKLSKVNPKLYIKPETNSEKDNIISKLSTSILNNCLNRNDFKKIISTATHWSEITGTSFYKINWNSDKGNVIGNIDGNLINSGDVQISACSPFEIYPDSNETANIEDCLSIIYAKAQPLKTIKEIYDIDVDADEIDTLGVDNKAYASNISGRSNVSKIIHSTKDDYAYVIERYEKPSKERPNGRLTIICKNKLLYDGDLPYKASTEDSLIYPFVKQISNKQLSCFWGSSVIERCIPIQRAYNALKNKKHEYISRLASGVLTVEDGSVDIDNLEDEGLAPGKILVYRNGSTPPTFMNPGTVPTELEKEEASLLNELNSLSCMSDVSTKSIVPSNITSGSAISMLIEQDESRLSLCAEYIRSSIKQVGTFVMSLFKNYVTSPRINKLKLSSEEDEIVYWTNNDITDKNVDLENNNELQKNPAEQKELLLTLFEKGFFCDANGHVSSSYKSQLINSLGIKNLNIEDDVYELQKKKASAENLEEKPLVQPLEIDDHKIHIEEHTKFILTTTLTKEQTSKLTNHIKQHKLMLNN